MEDIKDNEVKTPVEEAVKEDAKEEASKVENTEKASEAANSHNNQADEAKPKDKKKKKSKEEILIESLRAELNKLKEETAKDREAYLLAKADLENVRRRVKEDAIQERKYASMGMVSDLIQPVDMLIKASSMQTDDQQMKNFLIGFQMIANQITDVLKRDGLKEIEALNKDFDPNFHQALSKEHVEGVEPGKVIEVLQSGYMYKDRIIKPAMVKVSE